MGFVVWNFSLCPGIPTAAVGGGTAGGLSRFPGGLEGIGNAVSVRPLPSNRSATLNAGCGCPRLRSPSTCACCGTLVLVRELRHPPAKVWKALTEPDQLREWAPCDADRSLEAGGMAAIERGLCRTTRRCVRRLAGPSALVTNLEPQMTSMEPLPHDLLARRRGRERGDRHRPREDPI